jgi:hypothetical protein
MRCPVCKAGNAQGPQCRRCKADLSLLFALEEQRRRVLTEARLSLRRGEWQAAVEHTETADWLRDDDESRRLMATVHLLNKDFVTAWQCYRNWLAAQRSE